MLTSRAIADSCRLDYDHQFHQMLLFHRKVIDKAKVILKTFGDKIPVVVAFERGNMEIYMEKAAEVVTRNGENLLIG